MSVQIDGSTGNIIAIKADYSGDVSIGGTLTYEDVTNIDAVGLITARSGVKFGESGTTVVGNSTGIGIGEASPTRKLVVAGDTNTVAVVRGATDGTSSLFLGDSDDEDIGALTYNHPSNYLSVTVNASERLRITSDGKVGINTDMGGAPASLYPFSVYRSTGTGYVYTETAQSGASAGLRAKAGTADFTIFTTQGTGQLAVYDNTNSAERLRIDSSGKLKLGSNTLVTPNTDADNFVIDTGDADSGISILSATTGRIYFGDAASNDQGSIRYVHSDNSMRFETNSSEKVRITSGGHLLNGVTADEDTSGNSGVRFINAGDIQIDGDQQALVFRSTNNTAQEQSAIEWWNENGAGIQAKILCDRTAVSQAPGDLVFYTSANVDSGGSGSDGDITERLRITSAGKIQITGTRGGTLQASDNDSLELFTSATSGNVDTGCGLSFYNNDGNGAEIGGTIQVAKENGSVNNTAGYMRFSTRANNANPAEVMRITSGGVVRIGDSLTSNAAGKFQVVDERTTGDDNDCNAYFETGRADWNIKTYYNRSGTHYHLVFVEQGTERGNISGSDGANVTFNQGSDYRWKENIVEMTGTEGLEICKRLKPSRYNWIENREQTGEINTVDGFIAHEVVEAGVLGAVTGEKDAVNEDGSIKGQMLDYGQMTPVLAAAIKGLIAKVETLEAQVAALQG